jgi:hypothetical protein
MSIKQHLSTTCLVALFIGGCANTPSVSFGADEGSDDGGGAGNTGGAPSTGASGDGQGTDSGTSGAGGGQSGSSSGSGAGTGSGGSTSGAGGGTTTSSGSGGNTSGSGGGTTTGSGGSTSSGGNGTSSGGGGNGTSSGGGGSQCWVENGNPSCESLGLGVDVLTIENVLGGSYAYGGGSVSIMLSDVYFDFTSTDGMAAVIVKGGDNALVCTYVPATHEDYGLHAPINSNTGMPYGISHISFCE